MARRTGLGKGLDALIPTVGAVTGSRSDAPQLRSVPVGEIRANPHQPRKLFDDEEMASLSLSIGEIGVLQPILVREIDGGYELIAGERRLRAATRAGLAEIPVVVRTVDDEESMAQALVENLHRADLNPLEEAAAYQELLSTFSFTHEKVAKRVGKSRAAVSNTLRLLQLPAVVQRYVAQGQLSGGHARAILGIDSAADQQALADRVMSQGLSVRQVEDLVRSASSSRGSAKRRDSDKSSRSAGELEVERQLSDLLDTRVAVKMGQRKGTISISFADEDDLGRIFAVLTE